MKHFITIFFTLAIPYFSYSQPGTLDSNFNDSGTVLGPKIGYSMGMALQDDGKIVFGGNHTNPGLVGFYLARYLKSGIPDSSFGENGFIYSPKKSYLIFIGGHFMPIAVQRDGKIITCATGNEGLYMDNIVLVRYLQNGNLDPSFGDSGISYIDFGADEIIEDMALQEDGKILITGTSKNYFGSGQYGFLTARLNIDGSVDSSFGNEGKIIEGDWHIQSGQGANSVCIQPDGKIVVGLPATINEHAYFLIVRYLSDGTRDNTFGNNGMTKATFTTNNNADYIYNTAIQTDGKILALGVTDYIERTRPKIAMARFNSDGTIDPSFGSNGLVTTQIENLSSWGYDVAVQSNNKIVVTGFTLSTGNSDNMRLLRYLPNGLLDSTFAKQGYATIDFNNASDGGYSIAVQKDGNIVVSGGSVYNGARYFLARYHGDPVNKHPLYTKIKRWIRNHILNFEDSNPDADYYMIEKSTNGTNTFISVAKINALTPNGTYNYSIATTQTAEAYYRIKSVSTDNSVAYSPVINSGDPGTAGATVKVSSLKIFPNPANKSITIQSAKAVTVRLQNSNGIVLGTQKVIGSFTMDISKLQSGIYYVVLVGTSESYKLVKE